MKTMCVRVCECVSVFIETGLFSLVVWTNFPTLWGYE